MPSSDSQPRDIYALFEKDSAHPVVLSLVLGNLFGIEWFTWEPETLWEEISQRVGESVSKWNLNISHINRSKIQAVRTLGLANTFWTNWESFVPVINGLNNIVPDFETLHKPSIARMCNGVDIANAIHPSRFMGDVPAFVGACALDDGVCWLPDPLQFANPEINPEIYVCRECGNSDVLDPDGLCDVCSARYDKERNLDLRPHPKRVERGHGRALDTGYQYDWQSVRDRYNELAKMPVEDVVLREDNSTDTQVAKLLVARAYCMQRESEMKLQMEALGEWARPRH